jgi:MarR family transcriptional regulator, organic hydroperoxide resistance regulator
VSRRRSEDNGRTVAINLTPKGRALAEELMPIAKHFEQVAVRTFTPDEVGRIKEVLTTVYANLNSIEPEIGALRDRGRPDLRGAANTVEFRNVTPGRRKRTLRSDARAADK